MTTPGKDLSKIPFTLNPNGSPPNFIDPPSLEPAFLAVGITLMTISAILLAIRLFANWRHAGKLWFDDYLCILAWVTSIGYWALFRTFVAEGFARHAWDMPISIFTKSFNKRLLAQQILGNISTWAVKTGILALLIRIFDSIRWMRITAYTLIVFAGAIHLTAIAGWILDIAGTDWDFGHPARSPHKEITIMGWFVIIGVFGLVLDCIMFALPFPIISRLHMRNSKKLGLLVVFAVAFCTVVAACAALAYRIVAASQDGQDGQDDLPWNWTNVFITSFVEQLGGLIVSCAPGLASFWNNIFTKSRIYLSLHSKIRHRSSGATPQEYINAGPRRYASDEYLVNVRMKKYDPYPVTNLSVPSGVSEDAPGSKAPFMGPVGFITGVIPDTTPT